MANYRKLDDYKSVWLVKVGITYGVVSCHFSDHNHNAVRFSKQRGSDEKQLRHFDDG